MGLSSNLPARTEMAKTVFAFFLLPTKRVTSSKARALVSLIPVGEKVL